MVIWYKKLDGRDKFGQTRHEMADDKNSQEAVLGTVIADKFNVKQETLIERSKAKDAHTKDHVG